MRMFQVLVVKSTTEAGCIASSDAAQQAKWIRSLLTELGQELDGPMTVEGDNQGAIIEIDFHPSVSFALTISSAV